MSGQTLREAVEAHERELGEWLRLLGHAAGGDHRATSELTGHIARTGITLRTALAASDSQSKAVAMLVEAAVLACRHSILCSCDVACGARLDVAVAACRDAGLVQP